MSHPFVMHLIIHMFNSSMTPYMSLVQYLKPQFIHLTIYAKYAFLLLFSIFQSPDCFALVLPLPTLRGDNPRNFSELSGYLPYMWTVTVQRLPPILVQILHITCYFVLKLVSVV